MALIVTLAICPFLIAGINLGSIGIARVLRKQITFKLHQFTKPSYLPSTIDLASEADDLNEAIVIPGSGQALALLGRTDSSMGGQVGNNSNESVGAPKGGAGKTTFKSTRFRSGMGSEAGLPSRADIRRDALSGGVESEEATRIMVLQRAERDLVVVRFLLSFSRSLI